jgi:hypothetical protein
LGRTRRFIDLVRWIGQAALFLGPVLAIAGCGATLPSPGDVANHVDIAREGTSVIATVSPWPLDKPVAFFCLRQPGGAFSVDHPVPPAAAGCSPAAVSTISDRLSARFDPTALDPATAVAFASQQQWFLAVAGSRGPVSVATVLTVANIPAAKSPAAS